MDEIRYRRSMHRFERPGHARFLTFSCYQRLPLLNHDRIRELFLERLQRVIQEKQVRLLAWVLMPEHTHLVVFPDAQPDMAAFTHAIKRPFAEAVLRRWKELKAPILDRIRHKNGYRFWQTGGGYDRNLFNPGAVLEKVHYIHANPVHRKLVSTATDYPWSSARWYEGVPDAKLPCGDLPW